MPLRIRPSMLHLPLNFKATTKHLLRSNQSVLDAGNSTVLSVHHPSLLLTRPHAPVGTQTSLPSQTCYFNGVLGCCIFCLCCPFFLQRTHPHTDSTAQRRHTEHSHHTATAHLAQTAALLVSALPVTPCDRTRRRRGPGWWPPMASALSVPGEPVHLIHPGAADGETSPPELARPVVEDGSILHLLLVPTAFRSKPLRHRRARCITLSVRSGPLRKPLHRAYYTRRKAHKHSRSSTKSLELDPHRPHQQAPSGSTAQPPPQAPHKAPKHTHNMQSQVHDTMMLDIYPSTEVSTENMSPTKASQAKHVSFELLLPQSPQHRARLPMRVNIFPHDTTDSIITTVKNFYGLYERRGVVFEDRHGTTLIARYENFTHDMVVYVRVTAEDSDIDEFSVRQSASPRRPRLEEAFQMLPPSLSRVAGRQTESPQPGRGRRSASASTNPKRARPTLKSRGPSSHGSFAEMDTNNYSDSDGGDASVTSSRRSKKEPLASAEISADNIIEGGRRFKRAKFDSSELPLFVPPQVPMTASLSSVSPQRRVSGNNQISPYSMSNQQTFSYTHPLPSPQSYGQTEFHQGLITPYSTSTGTAHGYRSRTRSGQYGHRHSGAGGGVFPTPDPTLASASVISDEDVARQLMRLGDASNFSTHGRTSTSTLDDALSGKAELASSSEESDSDEEQDLPPFPFAAGRANMMNGSHVQMSRVYESADSSCEDYDDRDASFKGESDEMGGDEHHDRLQHNTVKARASVSSKGSKSHKARPLVKVKSKVAKPPMSPTSLPTQSRKTSSASVNGSHPIAADEEDLSSQPRCQRCRKSKKGCDRQRPCGRCKDAGIGIEGCISEDEGNGRKGRYGRHMGVTVKKTGMNPPPLHEHGMASEISAGFVNGNAGDKNKKRKR
ncbi:hypothetical protein P280DRAFT_222813 [Massarina eburnea CBS 473.64]|uniref:Zn(2)-C6 fungal-type domain-containing protein n=1 Tax=Massarina eburnea CBS 473.64 TaxID=1395130 RepID=A0A6A6SB59_9PLEO|nr:hypothetical protein P280DRAFT_222813 [Massarina eburnea CBS 473.64]